MTKRATIGQTCKFALTCSLLLLICSIIPDRFLGPSNEVTAKATAAMLAFLGRSPEIAGTVIVLDGFRVQVVPECTPIYSVVLFASFLLSVPASPWARAGGFLAGAFFLSAANVLRIAAVTMVGADHPALFEPLHVYLGQVVAALLVLACALAWQHRVDASSDGRLPFLIRAALAASLLFLPWLLANGCYVRALDAVMARLCSLRGYRLYFSYQHLAYYQTFNMVLFLALMLAETRGSPRRRICWTIGGAAVLTAGHLLFRFGNLLLTGFAVREAVPWNQLLSVAGLYLLPFLFWMLASAPHRERAEGGSRFTSL